MNDVRLNINYGDAEKIADCIKNIHRNVSGDDIVEIVLVGNGFLLEGKPRSEYQEYCNMFDEFIAGPAMEGREIAELTEKYRKFYDVMKAIQLKAKESNELEAALYGVAIEAEMQGFIYGFKIFDALLNQKLAVAG